MKVNAVIAPSQREVLDETRRRYGPDAMILSVQRHAATDDRKAEWEAIIGSAR